MSNICPEWILTKEQWIEWLQEQSKARRLDYDDDIIKWTDLYNEVLLAPITEKDKTLIFLEKCDHVIMMARDCLNKSLQTKKHNQWKQAIEQLEQMRDTTLSLSEVK